MSDTLCIHGWKLDDNPLCTAMERCKVCNEQCHSGEVLEIREKNPDIDSFPIGRRYRAVCETYPINWNIWERC